MSAKDSRDAALLSWSKTQDRLATTDAVLPEFVSEGILSPCPGPPLGFDATQVEEVAVDMAQNAKEGLDFWMKRKSQAAERGPARTSRAA